MKILNHKSLNKIDKIDNIYVINLEKRKDRLDKFQKNTVNLPPIKLFKAYDAKNFKIENKNIIHENETILKYPLTKKFVGQKIGEVGCFLSHYSVWLKIAESEKPSIIFEDDAQPHSEFVNKVKLLLDIKQPDDLEILWLGLWTSGGQQKQYRLLFKKDSDNWFNKHFYKLKKGKAMPYGAVYPYCYLIQPQFAKKLINAFHTYGSDGKPGRYGPVDGFIHRFIGSEYAAFFPNLSRGPCICAAPQGDSDIQGHGDRGIPNRIKFRLDN